MLGPIDGHFSSSQSIASFVYLIPQRVARQPAVDTVVCELPPLPTMGLLSILPESFAVLETWITRIFVSTIACLWLQSGCLISLSSFSAS